MADEAPTESTTAVSRLEGLLKSVEAISVILIALALWCAVGLVAAWAIFGIGDAQRGRLGRAIGALNVNWKIGLLVLIPLFYRTIREILERLEEGPLGTKFKPKLKTQKTQTDGQQQEDEAVATPKARAK